MSQTRGICPKIFWTIPCVFIRLSGWRWVFNFESVTWNHHKNLLKKPTHEEKKFSSILTNHTRRSTAKLQLIHTPRKHEKTKHRMKLPWVLFRLPQSTALSFEQHLARIQFQRGTFGIEGAGAWRTWLSFNPAAEACSPSQNATFAYD